jgi:transcriptional regulator with XRE-family HTH domain
MKEQRYVATNFWKVLKRQGRTIRWLAGETGVSENYISQMKAGRRAIRESFAIKASHTLSLPMDLLFLPAGLHDVDDLNATRDERAAD